MSDQNPIHRRKRHPPPPVSRVAHTVSEFAEATAISKPTLYRMMASGKLRYTQIGDIRRIPVSEYVRLGLLVEADDGAVA